MSRDTETAKPRREDYQRALSSMNTFMDIEVNDLMMLADRAQQFAVRRVTASIGVTQIMSKPVTVVSPQTTMSAAAHLMVEGRISGLPVVDDANRLLGIITEADFLRALGVPAHHPTHSIWQTLESMFSHLAHHAGMEGPNDPVAEHMVREVICVGEEQDVHDVLDAMKRHRVKRVLVCDNERHVSGVITRSDLVRIFFDRYTQGSALSAQVSG
ncbi:MAG: CBS domain-containing protein [Chromatiaceae bacterium]|nr:CBS domain-containing protein [Chromatiaceae bacterium]MCP5429720.1 CBS domain-containing protein [Chromatiaceae bacterium]HOP15160.1 CBS domain-containing protein [Gammaproteobacteria bacterium]HPQ24377.1 CBS domain-containing protein [Gammaproteobacteria bacterium]